MRVYFKAAAFALAMLASPALAAPPDFSTSQTSYEPSPAVAGDVVRYSVTVANTGGDSFYSRVVTTLPRGYFIDAGADCAQAVYDADRHALVWHEGGFPARTAKTCVVRLLTRRDVAGTLAVLATEINAPPALYHRVDAGPELGSPPEYDAVQVGPVMVTRAGGAALAWLAVLVAGMAVVARIAQRRGGRPGAAARSWAAIAVALGFLAYFALLALGDIRVYTDYRETSCSIVGGTVRLAASTGKLRSPATYAPIFAMRYEALGETTFSSGYASPTSVSLGVIGPSRQALERYAIGSTHPCWYDPAEPRTVLLERGPGGAYLFALFPLPVLALGLYLLGPALGAARRRNG